MTKDDQQLEGTVANEETTTPVETRESEDASEDLDRLFEEEPETQKDEQVSREELKRLEKGIQKLASQIGRQKEAPQKATTSISPVLKQLYFKANPEAKEVWDEVEKEAALLGKDPFELFEASSYFKGEARARAEAKRVEEEAKSKLNSPSSLIGEKGNLSFNQIDLNNDEHYRWLKAKKERMEQYKAWLLKQR